MKTITTSLNGLLASLLSSAGLHRLALPFDPLAQRPLANLDLSADPRGAAYCGPCAWR